MKLVTVVIPNYNGKKYIGSCLKSLYDNTEMEMDVIVTDNHSSDGSIEEIHRSYPEVQCICLEQNYGFGRAANEGIRVAKTPYVLLLNNDTLVQKGFVSGLLRVIERDRRIFSVEAKMLQFYHPDRIDSAGTFYNAFGWAFARGKDQKADNYEAVCDTFAACAGAAMYRKCVFEEIGAFDETYFAYLEDIDLGYRARLHGYRNVYVPEAKVLHVGSGTSGSRYNKFKVWISARNNLYLIYKNMPRIQILCNLPFLTVGFLVKWLFFLRMNLGDVYINGLKEGIIFCRGKEKNIGKGGRKLQYVRIQMELWMNMMRKRW